MTYRQWLAIAIARLTESDSAKRDAEILLGFITNKSRSFILAFDETRLNSAQLQQLESLLFRRCQGEPIAYLTGQREFWSLPLQVSPATLIPRPETECLVEIALAHITDASCTVLDLGTGSGAIALALASEKRFCQVMGVDCQPDAVELAQQNAQRLQINNVKFLVSHWFSALAQQRFAIIVSNPPYIDKMDPHLQRGDVRYEPLSALVAEKKGLADIETIIAHSVNHLYNKGLLAIEHGWQQASAVQQLFNHYGYSAIETRQDYSGNDRITYGFYA